MSANNPTTPPPLNPAADEAAQKKAADDAAALRYAAAHLKSKPLPPDFDPNKRATVGEALSSIKPDDFTRVHQAPCTREGLLTGIGGGAAVGALRYLTGGMSILSLSLSFCSLCPSSSAQKREKASRLSKPIAKQRPYLNLPIGPSPPALPSALLPTSIASTSVASSATT